MGWPLIKQWALIASEFIVNAGFEQLTDRPETGTQNMLVQRGMRT